MALISEFKGEYDFLSNFYFSPFTYNGINYPTVEHFFQASKATSPEIHQEIAAVPFPSQAKQRGRHIKLRPDWSMIREGVMETGLRQKFEQHPELKEKLLATGDAHLEEGNTWGDKFWGVCYGEGKNKLGYLLMKLRAEYQEESAIE